MQKVSWVKKNYNTFNREKRSVDTDQHLSRPGPGPGDYSALNQLSTVSRMMKSKGGAFPKDARRTMFE